MKKYLPLFWGIAAVLLFCLPRVSFCASVITLKITEIKEDGQPVKIKKDVEVVLARDRDHTTLAAYQVKLSNERVSYTTAAGKVKLDSDGKVIAAPPPPPPPRRPNLKDRGYRVSIVIEAQENQRLLPQRASLQLKYEIKNPEAAADSVFIPVSGGESYDTRMLNDLINISIEYAEAKLKQGMSNRFSLDESLAEEGLLIPLSMKFDIWDDQDRLIKVDTKLFAKIKLDSVSLNRGVESIERQKYAAGGEVKISKIVWQVGDVKVRVGGQVTYTYNADMTENPRSHEVATGIFVRIF